MKKIISILIMALIIGCFGVEAKTTKKSGKKKPAATLANYSQKGFGPGLIVKKSHGTYVINPNLAKDLQNNGFIFIESKIESLEYDTGDPFEEETFMDFSVSYFEDQKKGIKIKISNFLDNEGINDVIIMFSSPSSEKNFVADLLKMGYKKETYNNGYIDYGATHKGNLIRFGYNDGKYIVYYGG